MPREHDNDALLPVSEGDRSGGNSVSWTCELYIKRHLPPVYFQVRSAKSSRHTFDTSTILGFCSETSDLVEVFEQRLQIEKAKIEQKCAELLTTIKREQNAIIVDRDLARYDRDLARYERDAARHERDVAIAERDLIAIERKILLRKLKEK